MTLTLVTGATGLVGFNVVRTLVDRGRAVRVLARSVDKARRFMPDGVDIVAGDVTAPDTLDAAFEGCDVAYHAAGLPEQWLPDDRRFDEVNVGGTSNMIEAALRHGVRRFVYTSTIDVFEGHRGEVFDESKVAVEPKGTAYERSKQAADRKVVEALERSQLPAVFLHPAAVYGPGPAGSPGLNKMLADLRDRKVPMLLPGGLPIVFAPDVGKGHVLAEERAEPGDRFILCESFRPVSEIVRLALDALGEQRRLPPMMPSWVAHLTSRATEAWAQISGKPPLLPKGQLHFLGWGAVPSSARARAQLDWQPVPADEGLRRTVATLRDWEPDHR
jgi:dihydroflavonol-4-reductase